MNVYSIVSATIDRKVAVWLPACDDLGAFIEELSGIPVQADLKDGELQISGTLDAIINAEDSLRSYVQEKEQSANVIVIEQVTSAQEGQEGTQVVILDDDELMDEENEEDMNQSLEGSLSEVNGEDGKCKTEYKFSCTLCSYRSQREGQFKRHVQLHETITEVLRCDQCDFRTLRATQLTRHKITHSAVTLMCPSGCGYTTDDPQLLVKHQKRTNHESRESEGDEDAGVGIPNEPIIRYCDKCPYKTDRLYRFQRHMRTHTAGDGQSAFTCPDCDFRSYKKTHFTRHVRDVHSQTRPHLCHHCGKAFKRADALRQHSLQHLAGPDEAAEAQLVAFQCPICSRLCHSKNRLENHLAVHSSERAFLCEVCGAAFKTRSVHRKHVMNQHEKPASYACQLCDRRFNTKYDLERHMKRKRHPPRANSGEEDKKRKRTKKKV